MALIDSTWYVNFGDGSTTGYYAITRRPQNAAVAAGQIVRQFTAPAVGSERVFICTIAGTTANVTDATWVLTRGAKTTDGTVTWMECSGQASLNGDLTNTKTWTEVKAATPAVLGQVLKRSNNASYQICTTAGAMSAAEPTMSDTAGVTTTDTTAVWTSLGAVGNFTGGQAPHARLANALAATWFASGNTVYVADNHAETQNSNLTWAPASALMARILCHNHSGSYPPAASDITTGATITVTNASSFNITGQGSFYFYGLLFVHDNSAGGIVIGASTVGQVQNWYYFDNCSFQHLLNGTSSVQIGSSSASTAWGIITFNNTTMKFGGTAITVVPYFCQFVWQNTGQILASGSSVPLTLISNTTTGRFYNITLNNLDLSQLTGSLFTNASNSSIGTLIVQDCKLNAAMTVTTPINTGMNVQLIRSDSAGTSYKSQRINYEGIETTETSIVRTGGAVDPMGQAQSRKIVTSANAQWLRPFKAEPMVIWNAVTGANVTATVYGTVNAGALPNNDDIWLECEYLGSATDPLGTIKNTTKSSLLAANAAVASDSSSWGGGGSGAGWSPFKLTATLSSPQPQLAGYLHARVRAAKVSTTYYLDPKIELGIGAAWTPSSLTGLVGWWDASVFASMTITGGTDIQAMADQSGGGNNLIWVGFGRPQYDATGFNSKPAFVLQGLGTFNAFGNTSFPLGTGNTMTLWWVGKVNSVNTPTSNAGIVSYTGAGQTADWNNTNSFVMCRAAASTTQITMYRNATNTLINCAIDTNHRVIVTINSSGVQTFYVDGVAQTGSTVSGNWTSPGNLNIGRSAAGDHFAGPTGEVGIATGWHDAATVGQLDTYLKNKWGL